MHGPNPNTVRTQSRKSAFCRLLGGMLTALATLGLSTASAQNAPQLEETLELSTTPYQIKSLGLSIYAPEDSFIDSSSIFGGRTRVAIQAPDLSWIVKITNSITTDRDLTAAEALDNIIRQRQETRTVHAVDENSRPGRVLGSTVEPFDRLDTLEIAGLTGSRVYMRDRADDLALITGFTILPTRPGQFLLYELITPPEHFKRTRIVYEMVVASSEIRDPNEMVSERLTLLETGQRFLDSVTASDMERVLDREPRFFRIYKPAPTGAVSDAEEVAWQRMHFRKGQLGELEPDKPKHKWTTTEREYGFVVQVDARSVIDKSTVDTRAIFFLTRDRDQEYWSITNVIKQGEQSARWQLTGIQRDNRLTVKTIEGAAPPTTREQVLPESGYLSQVERYLLPRLVALKHGASDPGLYSFGYYFFDPGLGKTTLRRESFETTELGGWTQTTLPMEDAAESLGHLDGSGFVIKRELPNDQLMVPETAERLRAIWKQKSLPVD